MYSSILDLKTPLARTQGESLFPEHWDELVAAWPMLEGGGATAFDFSGRGSHAALSSVDMWSDHKFTFDGSSYRAQVASSGNVSLNGDFTIVAFLTPSSLPTSNNLQSIACKYDNGGPGIGGGYDLRLYNQSGTQKIGLATSAPGVSGGVDFSYTLTPGQMSFLAGRFSSSGYSIVVDDTLLGPSGSPVTPAVNSKLLNIGAFGFYTGFGDLGRYFNGIMWDLRLYSTELSVSELEAIKAAGPNGYLIPRRRGYFAAQLAAAANRRRRLLMACG